MSVDKYAADLDGPLQAIVSRIRQIMMLSAPGVTEAFKWNRPVFENNGPFAYVLANEHSVSFGFWRGIDIRDAYGLLHDVDGKIQHVEYTSADEINTQALADYIRQAIELNNVLGDPTQGLE
ncbi:MAG: DUF1801 domain-containing protein [Chloroflexi bacterium]|jgi:hypothetical protein|nr:DUF1801 domain-containing protein [Chloroflexota bacterium]MBT7082514.1 DUF1801 domain-containing protein [Chloroflexota bacterium]MBT7289215.1 DUF1801 domain-containing protein [Chloroflexota bacterium]